jgi:uncharacterized protein with PQ loop repeat
LANLLDYAPLAATGCAVPQFLPQIHKLRATDDSAGVSWSWATLTSVNNATWLAYFALSGYWIPLIPSSSATVLAATLTAMLTLRGRARMRAAPLILSWLGLLAVGYATAGRSGLGTLLAGAFILQVTPSIWNAYTTAHPSGVSARTWLLILGELSCWAIFGVHKSDPRLIILGLSGIAASALMLSRLHVTRQRFRQARPTSPDIYSSRPLRRGVSCATRTGVPSRPGFGRGPRQ